MLNLRRCCCCCRTDSADNNKFHSYAAVEEEKDNGGGDDGAVGDQNNSADAENENVKRVVPFTVTLHTHTQMNTNTLIGNHLTHSLSLFLLQPQTEPEVVALANHNQQMESANGQAITAAEEAEYPDTNIIKIQTQKETEEVDADAAAINAPDNIDNNATDENHSESEEILAPSTMQPAAAGTHGHNRSDPHRPSPTSSIAEWWKGIINEVGDGSEGYEVTLPVEVVEGMRENRNEMDSRWTVWMMNRVPRGYYECHMKFV